MYWMIAITDVSVSISSTVTCSSLQFVSRSFPFQGPVQTWNFVDVELIAKKKKAIAYPYLS